MSQIKYLGREWGTMMKRTEQPEEENNMVTGLLELPMLGYSYACMGCGLIWDRKHHAMTCQARSHAPKWHQTYGRGEGARGYPRVAVGRLDRDEYKS
jgi:hypothetical protein